MVKIEQLTARLNDRPVLDNVFLWLPSGSITVLVGPSGVGKTTLLRCLVGLQEYAGTILVDGKDIRALAPACRARLITYVDQAYTLFANLTVEQNVAQPLVVQGVALAVAQKRASFELERLGLSDFVQRYPNQLSGGQQQRAALARALAIRPRLLVLDEPSSALDANNTRLLAEALQAAAAQGMTVFVSTQDSFLQSLIGQRTITMSDSSCS